MLPVTALRPRIQALTSARHTLLPLPHLAEHLEESNLPRRLQVPQQLGVGAPELLQAHTTTV